ncbi:MAG TPA: MTH938/NDUFAF3 family protein [Anaerolineae bacterium]|nr:MTH938/NDUFAF3 family protein [Anaerolineae bacterium]HQJ51828.1 MTH938/NDUFAF3 family protein [Anaerolineae bacterium]
MSGLTAELERLGVRLGAKGIAAPQSRLKVSSSALRPAKEPSQGPPHRVPVESVIAGEVIHTPCGPCFVSESRFPLEHIHAGQPLSILAKGEKPTRHLVQLAGDERLSQFDLRSAIFFDIETTGLGIGAGMYAFLVGFGTFEGNEFCLRQYFMRDYGEEEGLLYLLDQQMRHFDGWVSFNGRAFDLPVLQSRFVCGRREMRLAQAPHLDLLYPSRKLWRKRLTSCRLSSLEAGVLGSPRFDDVPGWVIPELYFDYVRFGQVEPLKPVFHHNALDILSLVGLTATANRLLGSLTPEEVEHAEDLYSLALVYDALGETDAAQKTYEAVVERGLPGALQGEALRKLSALYKRTGQLTRAAHIWRGLERLGDAEACVQLAVYHEHHLRDAKGAAMLVGRLLELGEEALPKRGECSPESLKRRMRRLRKKLGEGGLPMPHIDSYSFGRIIIDGREHTADVLILPGGTRPGWRRARGHELGAADLEQALEARPSVIIIGTGNLGRMDVPESTQAFLRQQGVRFEVLRTAAACQRYNELAKKEQPAAALHLTC